MNRPYMICHMMTALDGKIMGEYMETQVADEMNNEYDRIHDEFLADAWMCGRVTMDDNFTFYKKPELREDIPEIPHTDYAAEKTAESYVVSIDPKGRLGWTENNIHGYAKRPPAHIIEVLTEQVSDAYLDYLQRFGISYIFAGKEHVDCALLVRKLADLFGIRKLLLEGGGYLNGSFMNEGLIVELSIVLAPIADGNSNTVTLFEKAEYLQAAEPMAFSLKSVERIGDSGLWIRYNTKQKEG